MEAVQRQPDENSISLRLDAEPRQRAKQPLWLRLQTWLAPTVIPILNSPLHPLLSHKLMLVTVKGRRTDTIYTFPVVYLELDALAIALVPNALGRGWWRNFIEPAYASITIRGARTPAQGFAPETGSPEFAMAAEQVLRRRRAMRRFFRVKLDEDKKLAAEQIEKLAKHARIVIFDRLPASAGSQTRIERDTSTLAPQLEKGADPEEQKATTEFAARRIVDLIGPVLAELEEEARPVALALAERVAAERYRLWAKEIRDPAMRKTLEQCSLREDNIAARIEATVEGALAIQQSIAQSHPSLAAEYLGLFDGMSLRSQFAFQAGLQRATATTWRMLADTGAPSIRSILLECSALSSATTSTLDTIVEQLRGE